MDINFIVKMPVSLISACDGHSYALKTILAHHVSHGLITSLS